VAVVNKVDDAMAGVLDNMGMWWAGWAQSFADIEVTDMSLQKEHDPEPNFLHFVPRNTKFSEKSFEMMYNVISMILSLIIVGSFVAMYVLDTTYHI